MPSAGQPGGTRGNSLRPHYLSGTCSHGAKKLSYRQPIESLQQKLSSDQVTAKHLPRLDATNVGKVKDANGLKQTRDFAIRVAWNFFLPKISNPTSPYFIQGGYVFSSTSHEHGSTISPCSTSQTEREHPKAMRILRAYALGYLTVTGPKLIAFLHVIRRKDLNNEEKLNRLFKILSRPFRWNRFPTFCALLTGGSTLLPAVFEPLFTRITRTWTKGKGKARPAVTQSLLRTIRFLAALLSAWICFPIINSNGEVPPSAATSRSEEEAATASKAKRRNQRKAPEPPGLKTIPFPCELVHMGCGPSCEKHALWRFAKAFHFSCATYLPIHLALRWRSRSVTVFVNAVKNALRSSAFLSCFISIFYYSVCLARTRLGPRLFSPKLVTPMMWDSGLCVAAGCMMCGWSILVENAKKRLELALFVAPRAAVTLLPRRYDKKDQWREQAAFSVSTAILITAIQERPEMIRGVFGRVLAQIFNH
ncbi:integral membrane protein [Histoplasma capsulatum var. duboisii H88]|uniref:Integral membrane protein n=1 Tax=Ajellomyces capsulatus (strain H88) TaxID=544711 RepID=F0UJ99_AJEC8|nr:integral membrane protein [Histoplasma capsulatum var. duboisii H88]